MNDPPESLRAGRYAVIRVLGEGSQAATFEAVDKKVGNLVAIKRFRVRGAKSWKEVELAEREARVLAVLDHPSIPRYVEHFEEGGDLYLVTRKIEGESLLEATAHGRSMGEADVVRFLHDASGALDYLHGRAPPVVHRDIKPSNVLRRPDGSFALIDFGAVRDRMKPAGGSTVVGTFGYMAPEQFQGRAMPASDVYAVGATALRVLTGVEPENLPHKGLGIDVAAALRDTRASPAMVHVLEAMLEPDPDRRASRIAPLLEHLDRAARRVLPSDRAPPAATSWRPPDASSSPRTSHKQRRRAERDARHTEREARWADRAARRAVRWREPRGRWGLPPIVRMIVLIALTLAQVAVTLAMRVVLPVLLAILAIAFGRRLRDAGQAVGRAGKSAATAIGRAKHTMHGRPDEGDASSVRVEGASGGPSVRVRVVGEAAQEEEEEELEAREREERHR